MPIILDSQKAMQAVRQLSFCYLCGKDFQAKEKRTDDHVPPFSLFAKQHRDFPLILPTHFACNHAHSADDQVITQLAGVLHGRIPTGRDRKLKIARGRFDDGSTGIGVRDLDLRGIIRRWVQGFHAALYREPLHGDAFFSTNLPLPEGRTRGVQVQYIPLPDAVRQLVAEIKRNRATGTLDRIVCRQGHCQYECVWTQGDRGEWICIYGLDIYDWKDLGDVTHFDAHGCVGCYRPSEHKVPTTATRATRLQFPVQNVDPLDPFGH